MAQSPSRGEPNPGADVGGGEPSPGADVDHVGPMQGRAGFRLCSSSLLRQRISPRRSFRRRSPPPFAANRGYRVTPAPAPGRAPLCHICSGTGAHPRPHLRRDRARPAHICAGTARAPAKLGTRRTQLGARPGSSLPIVHQRGGGVAPPIGIGVNAQYEGAANVNATVAMSYQGCLVSAEGSTECVTAVRPMDPACRTLPLPLGSLLLPLGRSPA